VWLVYNTAMRSRAFIALIVVFSPLAVACAQNAPVFDIPKKTVGIVVDGFLDEWTNLPGLSLKAGAPGVQAVEKPADAEVLFKAVWDEENLYVALQWKDDVWDIENIPRAQAVWLSPEHQRRDRNLFYDYFKFSIRELEYDYLFWVSPRINNRGSFFWQRLLEKRGSERATSAPAVAARDINGVATLEIRFQWRELKTKAKPGKTMNAVLLVSDGDQPGMPLEVKAPNLKALEWDGVLRLAK